MMTHGSCTLGHLKCSRVAYETQFYTFSCVGTLEKKERTTSPSNEEIKTKNQELDFEFQIVLASMINNSVD